MASDTRHWISPDEMGAKKIVSRDDRPLRQIAHREFFRRLL
jgi:hypothetical protein